MILPSPFSSPQELFSLKSKTAVVIGGGGHICSALAKGFAAAGASVAVADIRIEKAEIVARAINDQLPGFAAAFEVNASSKESLLSLRATLVDKYETIEVLINGGGINSPKPVLEISETDWSDVLESQLTATLFGCQVFAEIMLPRANGSIINISSASADPALSKAFAYSAAKAGIRNLTQNLGREWGTSGVRVNALRPGFFPTEWNKKNFITPEREASILGHTPMKRFGETIELIPAALFLASDASSFVTGTELIVDGGFSAMTI
jgi:NAD(P)-dependent dehydrogenase (short-subunit alcohol dehydrogenase family)